MSNVVLLDSGPLGLITNPVPHLSAIRTLETLRSSGVVVAVPEICDYEVRRELLRGQKPRGVARLDRFVQTSWYLPITTPTMRRAAELWAQSRRHGRPTSDPHSPDADVILAATALSMQDAGHEVVVATDNARHLSLFVDARHWSDIEFGDTAQE